jgi:hypothetical protein
MLPDRLQAEVEVVGGADPFRRVDDAALRDVTISPPGSATADTPISLKISP